MTYGRGALGIVVVAVNREHRDADVKVVVLVVDRRESDGRIDGESVASSETAERIV